MIENIEQEKQAKKLLQDREKRFFHQQQLVNTYGHSLLVIKANYPGSCKQNPHSTTAVAIIWQLVKTQYATNLVYYEITSTMEGMVVYAMIREAGRTLKYAMVTIEDQHPLGRLVDVDVFTKEQAFTRSDFHFPVRSCYLCGDFAHACVRSQKHDRNDVQAFFHETVEQYCTRSIEKTILFALLAEVSCYPKFGLVTPFSNGSHQDMDFALFIRSSLVIAPLLAKAMTFPVRDRTNDKEMFQSLRELGITIEEAMIKETNGINTHKGAIFLFLLVLMGYRLQGTFAHIPEQIKLLGAGLKDDFLKIEGKDLASLSHGERLYKDHGISGVRGLAMDGAFVVFNKFLPFYESLTGQMNERLVQTLLLIMEVCEDTTVVHRGGIAALDWLRTYAREVRLNPALRITFEKECLGRNLSPGGSADILALVVLLSMLQRYQKEEK